VPERVENSQAGSDTSSSENSHNWRTIAREHAQVLRARFEEERQEAQRERRAGRPKGELTQSLQDKLGDCNILQLHNVKKLCDRHIKRQRKPPSEHDCSCERYTVLVLGSVTVKTTRFRLEFRRSSFRAERVYVNGPYIRRYWWDGSIVKSKHVTKGKNLRRNLPKKVWVAFRDLLDRPENEEKRRTLIEKLQRVAAAIQ
jgi:hypothetical protein